MSHVPMVIGKPAIPSPPGISTSLTHLRHDLISITMHPPISLPGNERPEFLSPIRTLTRYNSRWGGRHTWRGRDTIVRHDGGCT